MERGCQQSDSLVNGRVRVSARVTLLSYTCIINLCASAHSDYLLPCTCCVPFCAHRLCAHSHDIVRSTQGGHVCVTTCECR